MTFLSFLYHRSRYYWLLLLTLVLGVVLATTFLASGPILIDAVLEFGLRRTLLNADAKDDVFYLSARESSNQGEFQALHQQVQDFFEERLNYLHINLTPAGHVGFMYPWKDGVISLDRRLTMGFYGTDQNELSQHVDFLSGSFPDEDNSDPHEIQVVIGAFLSEDIGINVGDRFPVSISSQAILPEFNLRVTGIITPKDYHDTYWLDHYNPFWPLEGSGDTSLYGVFVDRESFFGLANKLYPSLDVSYSWQATFEVDQFTFENIEILQNTFDTVGNELLEKNENLQIKTTLVELLSDYTSQANIVRAPLYFLIGIVVLMVLYYLVMMSSLYLEQVRSEFAILRSRGASGNLLFKMEVLEGVFLSAVAIIIGPFFGWVIVRRLASSGSLSAIAEPGWGLSIPQAAWLSAGIAAAACVSSLLLPLPGALKRSITTYQQNLSRAGQLPWWQRFYLDVFTLTIGVILLYRVQLYGSIIGGSAENPQLDLMLLLAPLFLLLGTAAIFLRIFPVFLRRSASLASRGRGLPVVLALQQAAREPRHVTRLVLLLMLAMALGLFSTSLDATMAKNEVDRSYYFVGGDLRVNSDPSDIETGNVPGILKASWIWRSEAALITSTGSPWVDLLAVDPEAFSKITRYRADFAAQPVVDLLDQLNADWEENRIPLPAAVLPGEPDKIGLWFSLPFSMLLEPTRLDVVASTIFEARLLSFQGEEIIVRLEPINLTDDPDIHWYYFQGEVPELSLDSYPLSLISLWMNSTTLELRDFEAIWMDDISVVDRNDEKEVIIESFEYCDPYSWKSMTYPMDVYLASNPHTGESSLAMYFATEGISPLRWYGIHQLDDLALQPVPALFSPKFLEHTELQPGDLVRIKVKIPGGYEWDPITFKILEVVDYFPTLYETQEAGFMVAPQEPIFEQINLYRYTPIQGNELLISTADPDATGTNFLESGLFLDQVLSADSILLELRTNPLTIGLRSVTFVGYFLTTVLSLIGFGTHFYLSTRQRAANYSILRALGLSPRQLYTTLLVEQIVLMLSGLALGTVLGILLNQLTLTGLPLRLGELDTIPPFIVQMDWSLVVRVYSTLVIAFLISLGLAIFFLWRVQIHRVLRIGDE